MKLCITGDWHLRSQRPRNRIDDYEAAQEKKVRQVLHNAHSVGAVVLQPGDFFDSIEVPWSIVEKYIRIIGEYGVKVYCVRGQHDLRYHSRNVDNTPLAVMEAAGVVKVVGSEGVALEGSGVLYGCSWGERVAPSKGLHRILLVHTMVVKDKKVWPGQEEFVTGKRMLERHHEFELIVSGDNHDSFTEEKDGRFLVNCGSLMRSSIDQVKHRPVMYGYDMEKGALSRPVYLQVDPPSAVFDTVGMKEEEEKNSELEEFVKELSGQKDLGLNFLDNLRSVITKAPYGVRKIVEEALENV